MSSVEQGFIEQGKNGQLIEWHGHLLTGVMRTHSEDMLLLVPTLHPADAFADRKLTDISSDQNGVRWSWRNNWNRVKVSKYCNGKEVKSFSVREHEGSFVKWDEEPFCDHIELTPQNKSKEGVTVRLDRPAIVNAEFARFNDDDYPYVRVDLISPMLRQRARVWPLQADGKTGFYPWPKPLNFDDSGQAFVDVKRFLGVIAVLLQVDQYEWRLVDQAVYDPKRGVKSLEDEDEIRKIKEVILTAAERVRSNNHFESDDWLGQWPHRSQERLRYIKRRGADLIGQSIIEQIMRAHPTGLARVLVLNRCKFNFPIEKSSAVEELNDQSFHQALKKISPSLLPDFDQLLSPEQEWVIQHLPDARVPETISWARGRGVEALDLAFALVNIRKEAETLKNEIRDGCDEGNLLKALLEDIGIAPWTNGSFSGLDKRLRNINNRVLKDDKRPIDPEGAPPIRWERFRRWQTASRKMQEWRLGLQQLITYCESGVWEPPHRLPSPKELEEKLERIKAPANKPRYEHKAAVEEALSQHIDRLIDNRFIEPGKKLRDFAVERMEKIIRPNINIFGALHAEIRRAEAILETDSAKFAWVANEVGHQATGKGLNERTRTAHLFLELYEALESCLKSWRETKLTRTPNDMEELKAILSYPTHPQIEVSYQRFTHLYKSLNWPRFRDGLKPFERLPSPPKKLSMAGFSAWWDSLRNLDESIKILEQKNTQLKRHVEDINKQLIPAVKSFVDYWERQPANKQPVFYKKVKDCYNNWQKEYPDCNPETVDALIRCLPADWRDHLPQKD